jgi:hypothetical protein
VLVAALSVSAGVWAGYLRAGLARLGGWRWPETSAGAGTAIRRAAPGVESARPDRATETADQAAGPAQDGPGPPTRASAGQALVRLAGAAMPVPALTAPGPATALIPDRARVPVPDRPAAGSAAAAPGRGLGRAVPGRGLGRAVPGRGLGRAVPGRGAAGRRAVAAARRPVPAEAMPLELANSAGLAEARTGTCRARQAQARVRHVRASVVPPAGAGQAGARARSLRMTAAPEPGARERRPPGERRPGRHGRGREPYQGLRRGRVLGRRVRRRLRAPRGDLGRGQGRRPPGQRGAGRSPGRADREGTPEHRAGHSPVPGERQAGGGSAWPTAAQPGR